MALKVELTQKLRSHKDGSLALWLEMRRLPNANVAYVLCDDRGETVLTEAEVENIDQIAEDWERSFGV